MATLADSNTGINDISFAPNVLDAYESYTYNFALKLYDDSVFQSNSLPSSTANYVIIAQSGATAGFNIRSVVLESQPSVTRENRGALTTKVKMELDEPLGFTFIDRLLQAGKDLGLPTLNNAPYILELNFTGWDANGNPNPTILPTKKYRLNLTRVIPELRKGGSSYSLEFAPQNDLVQQPLRSFTQKTIIFQKAIKLTDTLNNFAIALTDASDIAAEGTNYTVAGSRNNPTRLQNTYKIVVQNGDAQLDQLSSWTMMSNTTQNAQRQFEVTPANSNTTQFNITIHPNKDIFEVITGILANTNEGYKYLSSPSDPAQAQFNGNDPTNFFSYETTTINQNFDPSTGSYSQLHTITIIPKVVSRLGVLTTQPGTQPEVTKLMNNNLLVKAYEYIFTGHNTSVIDLNMDFSTMWTDVMPLFLSLLRDGAFSSNQAPNTSGIRNILPYVPAVNKYTTTQNSNQSTPFALTANQPDLAVISSGQAKKYLEDYPVAALTVENFARQEPDRHYEQTENYTKGFSTPGDQASNAKISIFGYLADNAHANISKPVVSGMLSVNLIIRGDPYWLGITSEEASSNYGGQTYVQIRKSQRNYATYQSGEQNFYLKFVPPQQLDTTSTGLMQFNSSSVFNTVYSVMKVTSTFEHGVFRQDLLANINRSFQSEAVQNTANPLLQQNYNNAAPLTTPQSSNPQIYNAAGATVVSTAPNTNAAFSPSTVGV